MSAKASRQDLDPEGKCLWWSDPGSEFSDRVRVNIGAGLGKRLANQKPPLGPCSQWDERGFLWPLVLASVSWCRAGMVELSLSGPLWGHLSLTGMSLAHSLVSVTVTLLLTWPASWQNDTQSSGSSSSDNQTRIKVPRYLKTKTKILTTIFGPEGEADNTKQPASTSPGRCPAASKVSDTEEVALIFIITPAHDQSYRPCVEKRIGTNQHYNS